MSTEYSILYEAITGNESSLRPMSQRRVKEKSLQPVGPLRVQLPLYFWAWGQSGSWDAALCKNLSKEESNCNKTSFDHSRLQEMDDAEERK